MGGLNRAVRWGFWGAGAIAHRVVDDLRRVSGAAAVAVASRSIESANALAAAHRIRRVHPDLERLLCDAEVDVVYVSTPHHRHAADAIACLRAGKAVLCEKPLALSYPQAAEALAAVTRAGVPNAIGFNYRRLPAVALMQRMVAEGAVGEIRLWRATWLSDEFTDPDTPFDWRFDRAMGGTTIADLGSHLIDLALWLAGDIRSVCAQAETFIRARPQASGGTRPVTVDDAASALLRFGSGALGTIEVARAAVRRPCDFTIEVNGSRGTLVFDYARLNELRYGRADDEAGLYGMRRIRAEHPSHPYAADWWPLGQGVGDGSSFGNQGADLLEGWPDAPWSPGFGQGAAVQAVCDAMEASAAQDRWVAVSEVTGAT